MLIRNIVKPWSSETHCSLDLWYLLIFSTFWGKTNIPSIELSLTNGRFLVYHALKQEIPSFELSTSFSMSSEQCTKAYHIPEEKAEICIRIHLN